MSRYLMDLMKPIRDNEDFKGAVRNVKNNQKRAKKIKRVIFKGDGSLDTLFNGFGRDLSCSRLFTCMGILWNKSEAVKTSKKP